MPSSRTQFDCSFEKTRNVRSAWQGQGRRMRYSVDSEQGRRLQHAIEGVLRHDTECRQQGHGENARNTLLVHDESHARLCLLPHRVQVPPAQPPCTAYPLSAIASSSSIRPRFRLGHAACPGRQAHATGDGFNGFSWHRVRDGHKHGQKKKGKAEKGKRKKKGEKRKKRILGSQKSPTGIERCPDGPATPQASLA